MYVHMYASQKEGIVFSEFEVMGVCVSPDMGAGNKTWVLCKNIRYFFNTETISPLLKISIFKVSKWSWLIWFLIQ